MMFGLVYASSTVPSDHCYYKMKLIIIYKKKGKGSGKIHKATSLINFLNFNLSDTEIL